MCDVGVVIFSDSPLGDYDLSLQFSSLLAFISLFWFYDLLLYCSNQPNCSDKPTPA